MLQVFSEAFKMLSCAFRGGVTSKGFNSASGNLKGYQAVSGGYFRERQRDPGRFQESLRRSFRYDPGAF